MVFVAILFSPWSINNDDYYHLSQDSLSSWSLLFCVAVKNDSEDSSSWVGEIFSFCVFWATGDKQEVLFRFGSFVVAIVFNTGVSFDV